jgi:hypothetical protein
MKLTNVILGLSLLLTASLFGQTKQAKQSLIDFLEADSQTNIIVIRNGEVSQPCPPKYTNLISNTNLFSPAEQKLLKEIPLKYKNVTTNSGPQGSVLASLNKDTNGYWVARFQYTNSEMRDEVTFGIEKAAKFLNKADDGYGVSINYTGGRDSKSMISFGQLKHGKLDGLLVKLCGEDHCLSWMHFANGEAVGKWLEWESDNGLSLEVEFKKPYDFQRYVIPLNIQ